MAWSPCIPNWLHLREIRHIGKYHYSVQVHTCKNIGASILLKYIKQVRQSIWRSPYNIYYRCWSYDIFFTDTACVSSLYIISSTFSRWILVSHGACMVCRLIVICQALCYIWYARQNYVTWLFLGGHLHLCNKVQWQWQYRLLATRFAAYRGYRWAHLTKGSAFYVD